MGSRNRMAYLLLFDANKIESFKEALKQHEALETFRAQKGILVKPLVYLVANKIDMDDSAEDFKRIIYWAEREAADREVSFYQVSALKYKNVKKLFRCVVHDVRRNVHLWRL